MVTADLLRSTAIVQSPRVQQLLGMFDIPPSERSELSWQVDLPLDERKWNIGLIVGPSGSGKSTILAEMFPAPRVLNWPEDAAVIDGFPKEMSVKDITAALSSVGFSSPPSWLRPFGVLSNGEQFRADLARRIAESEGLAVLDEFTSVIDRTVAEVASAAVARFIRREDSQLVAASCHYDIVDWLQPDWLYDTGAGSFSWRSLCPRPSIDLEVYRTTSAAWRIFHRHHYLSGDLHRSAKCWVALVNGRPAAFASALPFPHPTARNIWREHRTVCVPDFQGVGIGNAISELIASVFVASGKRYRSVTSSPAMIQHRARSALWNMARKPSMIPRANNLNDGAWARNDRLTATFEYVGPKASDEQVAILLGQ
jgi:hypothetical protein